MLAKFGLQLIGFALQKIFLPNFLIELTSTMFYDRISQKLIVLIKIAKILPVLFEETKKLLSILVYLTDVFNSVVVKALSRALFNHSVFLNPCLICPRHIFPQFR